MNYGPTPQVGRRVRHFHPHIDQAIGTVARVTRYDEGTWYGPDNVQYGLFRVYLVDCEGWGVGGKWGPVDDTYFNNIAEPWEYVDDEAPRLETPFSTPEPTG